jgi:sensor histidine kinase regulating citrate/malate metabolism
MSGRPPPAIDRRGETAPEAACYSRCTLAGGTGRPVPVNPRTIFDAVLDALIEPVIVTDADGVITFANATAAQCFGADKDVGLHVSRHLARMRVSTPNGQPLPPPLHPMSRAIAQQQSIIGAELTITSDQAESTYVVNTVPVWSGDQMMGTVSVFHDVTTAARLEHDVASTS